MTTATLALRIRGSRRRTKTLALHAAGKQLAFCDPEIILDKFGELVSFYKKDPLTGKSSGVLLTPEQVAKCVKFFWLEAEEVNGLPQARLSPYTEDVQGLKVNVIGGATGSGKTSLIHIMAGGMETSPKSASKTKCPSVYLFKDPDGMGEEVYAVLDTAGLCDTAATAAGDVGLQELLINAVAATVKMYDLKMVSFLMCVDVAGRLPGNFADVWPQMQISLGGDGLAEICHFVVTKANGDSKVNKAKLAKLPDEEFYKELVYSPLKWPVSHAGRENLHGLQDVVQPTSANAVGIGAESVDPDAQSLASKKKLVSDLEQKIATVMSQQEEEGCKAVELADSIEKVSEALCNAWEELENLGWCSDSARARLKSLIATKKNALTDMLDRQRRGISAEQQLKVELKEWDKQFKEEMQQIRRMYGLGAFFKTLAGGVADAAAAVRENVMPGKRQVQERIDGRKLINGKLPVSAQGPPRAHGGTAAPGEEQRASKPVRDAADHGLQDVMQPTSANAVGIGAESVDPDAQ